MKLLMPFILCAALFAGIASAEAVPDTLFPPDGRTAAASELLTAAGSFANDRPGANGADIDNLIPRKKEDMSLIKVLALDVFVPGGGHFYRGDYFTGGMFVLLKAGGAYSIYFFYQDWEYRKSLYLSAKRANARIDPHHELRFKSPDGGWKTVSDFRHEYDRAAIHLSFTVIANICVYAVSVLINYNAVAEYNERAVPAFEVYSGMSLEGVNRSIGVSYTFRI